MHVIVVPDKSTQDVRPEPDQETGWITSTENPFGAKVLPMCQE